MSLLLVASILVRVAALVRSLQVWRALRDWRVLFLVATLAMMALRQMLTLLTTDLAGVTLGPLQEIPGLFVSGLMYVAVVHLGRVLREQRQAVRSARDGFERWRSVLGEASDTMWLVDPNRQIVEANQQSVELVGYEPDELVGKSIDTLVDPEELARDPVSFDHLAGGQAFRRERTLRRKDGRPVRVEVSARRLSDGRILSILRDVTERSRWERELQESHERLDLVLRVGGIGFWDWDVKNNTLFWSDTVYEIFGVDQDRFQVAYDAFLGTVHPDDRERVRQVVQAALETGDPYYVDHRIVRPDGAVRYVSEQGQLTVDPDGSPLRMLGTVVDITSRAEAERALSDSREMLTVVLDTIPVRVFWKDRDLVYLGCNTAFARDAGFETPAEVIGRDDFAMGWRDQAELYRADDRQVIDRGEPRLSYEEPQTTPDGRTIWLRTSKTPLRDASGAVIGVLGTYEDITEAKLAEQQRASLADQLQHAQKLEAVGRLAGGVAHDFNNILTVIRGYTDLLVGELDDAELADAAREIGLAQERAASLTRQLLAVSRKRVIQPRIIDLRRTVQELESLLRRVFGDNHELRFHYGERIDNVRADAGHIEQIVMNLVINARDASPEAGEIVVELDTVRIDELRTTRSRTLDPGSYVTLRVRDRGVGMRPDVLDRAFEPFFTTKPADRGTGLGLSTVYGIVEQLNGGIMVESAPQVGTTFTVYLQAVDLPPDAEAAAPQRGREAGGTERIMIVEDDDALLKLVSGALSRLGYRVTSAPNGLAALELLRDPELGLDLLVTDLVMPLLSGRDLVERVTERRGPIPVIYISGYADPEMGTFAIGEEYLEKPFSPDTLCARVRATLDAARSRA